MLATITRFGTGRCLIKGVETEGVEVEFKDGSIRGFLGWSAFQKLLKSRTQPEPQTPLFDRPTNP